MDTLKFSKENIGLILIFILLIIVGLHFHNMREKFSTSGLALSDIDCEKLAMIYNPQDIDGICGQQRRSTVTYKNGNYYTVDGYLI